MNPIVQALQSRSTGQTGVWNLISEMRTGNADALYNKMMQENPQFAKFVRDNQGRSPEQIAKAYGIDLNSVLNRIGAQIR